MPHIVVEHSQNLESLIRQEELLVSLRNVLLGVNLFTPDAIKARAISYSDYVLHEGDESFIHTTVSILEGRSVHHLQALSQQLFDVIKSLIPEADKVSVNIHEMNAANYRK